MGGAESVRTRCGPLLIRGFMTFTIGLLVVTFFASLGGLGLFIWSMSNGLFGPESAASRVIFGAKEIGLAEEPAAASVAGQNALQETMNRTGHTGEFSVLTVEEANERLIQDASGKWPVLLCIGFAVAWLIIASTSGGDRGVVLVFSRSLPALGNSSVVSTQAAS